MRDVGKPNSMGVDIKNERLHSTERRKHSGNNSSKLYKK